MPSSPDVEDYADQLGDVYGIWTCPECGEDLRLEFREDTPTAYVGAACPDGCFGALLRVGGRLDLDSAAEKRQPDRCFICRDEVHDWDGEPIAEDEWPLHEGDCAEEYQADKQLLGDGGFTTATDGDSDE